MLYFLLLSVFIVLAYLYHKKIIDKKKLKVICGSLLFLLSIVFLGVKVILLLVITMILLYFIGKDRPFEKPRNQTNTKNTMDYDEALKVMGLSGNPDEEQVRQAYKKLITKYHPDKGGNDYFATKINQAKEILLKEI